MASKIPNQTRPACRQAGFTLIEILVSVTLLLLMSGLLVAGYNNFNDTQAVKQAATSVKSNLRAIRTDASFGKKPDGCETLVGYTIEFPDESTYQAVALCVVGGTQQQIGQTQTYTLPKGMKFSPIPQSVVFYALERGASRDQILTIVGATSTAIISVSTSGVVDDYVSSP